METDEIRLQADVSVEEKAAELAGGHTAQSEKPKRGRGRPRGSSTRRPRARPRPSRGAAQSEPIAVEAEVIEPPRTQQQEAEELKAEVELTAKMLYVGMGAFVRRKFPDEPYTVEEANALALPVVLVAKKYGGLLDRWKEEIALVLVVGMQIGERAARASARQAESGAP